MRRQRYLVPETSIVCIRHDDVMVGFLDTSNGISANDSDMTNVGIYTGVGADESDAKSAFPSSAWDAVGGASSHWDD